MNIEMIGRNVQIDDHLRDLVVKKLDKIDRFLEEPIEIRVTFWAEKHTRVAELHATHRFGVLQATEETDGTFDEALHQLVEKVEKQARRTHEKQVDKRRRGGNDHHRWPVEVLEQGSIGGGGVPRVIENTQISIKPMTIEEAALELEGSENGFVVFRDATNDRLSVLYKRKDQHYGLIAPEF
jgi:putative sigma-54 modulation protein